MTTRPIFAERAVDRLLSHGLALLNANKAAEALRVILGAYPRGTNDRRVLAQKAYAHAMLGQVGLALADASRAMQAPEMPLGSLDLLGHAFTLCHQPEHAHTAFTRARQMAPNNPGVLFNVATTAGFLGLRDEAEHAYDRVIALTPDNAEAWLNRSLLRRQTVADNHVPHLTAALQSSVPNWQYEVHMRFALGKELEDLGDHAAAFVHFARGAKIRRNHMRYCVADDIAAMERIAQAHHDRWSAPARGAPVPGNGPIFIVGMPRSGSTLLERMLGQHHDVQALGELPFFGQALIGAFRASRGRTPAGKDELIDRSADLDPAGIGAAYLAMAAPLRDGRPRFTDKLPINFLYAGLIAKAIPDATILHIRRDPLDLCFAVFKTLFRDAYPYSYDLEELGAYHQGYRALMDHWRDVLGPRLVEIDYEDLVAAPRKSLEELLPRLGLDFREECLRPEEGRAAVMTASAAQVRRSIHTSSIGSAARHSGHLAPLRAALGINQIDARDEESPRSGAPSALRQV